MSDRVLPIVPKGYRMLVKQVVQRRVSKGGLILSTEEEQKRQQAGFPIYEVLAMGDACYKSRDGQGFPEGPWCKVGDVVIMDGYAGKAIDPREFEALNEDNEEFLAELKEMRDLGLKYHLVNDDNVMAVYKRGDA